MPNKLSEEITNFKIFSVFMVLTIVAFLKNKTKTHPHHHRPNISRKTLRKSTAIYEEFF